MAMNYQSYFTTTILNRAYHYANNHSIRNLEMHGNFYSAKVRGTEVYHVEIEVEEGYPVDMTCTCPYARSGLACKHMAAVLIFIEQHQIGLEEDVQSNLIKDLDQDQDSSMLSLPLEKRGNCYRLKEDYIKDIVFDSSLYNYAKFLYEQHKVHKLIHIDPIVYGFVQGGQASYMITFEFDQQLEIESLSCSCTMGFEGSTCGHIGAVLMAMEFALPDGMPVSNPLEYLCGFERDTMKNPPKKSEVSNEKTIPYYFEKFSLVNLQPFKKERLHIKIHIEARGDYHQENICKSFSIIMDIGKEKLYRLKDIGSLLDARAKGVSIPYGKAFTYDPNRHWFSSGIEGFFDFLMALKGVEGSNYRYYHYDRVINGKLLNLNTSGLRKQFLQLLDEIVETDAVYLNYNLEGKSYSQRVDKIEEDFKFPAILNQKDENYGLYLNQETPYMRLTEDFSYIAMDGKIYGLTQEERLKFQALEAVFLLPRGNKREFVPIPKAQVPHFLEQVYPHLETILPIEMPETWTKMMVKEPLSTAFYIEPYNEQGLWIEMRFSYGAYEFNALRPTSFSEVVLVRDYALEETKAQYLITHRIEDHKYVIDEEEAVYYFLEETVKKLQTLGEVFYDEKFKLRTSPFQKVVSHIGMTLDDYMKVEFETDYTEVELQNIYNSIRLRKKFIRLKDGSFINIDNKEAEDFKAIVAYLELEDQGISKEVIMPLNKSLYLEGVLEAENHLPVIRKPEYQKFIAKVTSIDEKAFRIPKALEGILRHYQVAGFRWLKGLAAYNMGGILADDMGLGKTLQTIAFIASEYDVNPRCSLIVVPTSLVYNWEDEVRKFAPSMKILVISGSKAYREVLFEENFDDYAMVITSYPLLLRDLQYYKAHTFSFCILDEAQKIKNPAARSTKAVKQIKARSKFALTGTPIENNLMELWSIFDFIMPGYLATQKIFSQTFDKLIGEGDDYTVKRLKYHIKPFMIRRLKTEVLTELPDKIITKSLATMSKEQEKLYLSYLQRFKESMASDIESQGFDKSRIKILAYLTRLRQICCHPALFVENYQGNSGKMDLLEELLEDSLEAGHRILVFSQFTSMLELILQRLKAKHYSYLYLSGATKAEKRREMVETFQQGHTNIFLISLKAGGTGLNITEADMVIHVDPWWNPAVEDQATDRAYRIGQKNNVQVIKLITKGTIEEKIYDLQEKKRDLVDQVIESGESPIIKLNQQELRALFG